MIGFWNQDNELRELERQFKKARDKYYKASKAYNKANMHISGNNYNFNVSAISRLNAAEKELIPILERYNTLRAQLGMKPVYVYGINKWRQPGIWGM